MVIRLEGNAARLRAAGMSFMLTALDYERTDGSDHRGDTLSLCFVSQIHRDISVEYQQAAKTDQRKAVKTHREPVGPGVFVTLAPVRQVAEAEQPVTGTLDPDCARQGAIDQQAGKNQDYEDSERQLDDMHAFLYRGGCYKRPGSL